MIDPDDRYFALIRQQIRQHGAAKAAKLLADEYRRKDAIIAALTERVSNLERWVAAWMDRHEPDPHYADKTEAEW
ncbi:MAG: hypothetical protein AB1760_00090 [Pseudomonadota bacterium]